MVEEKRFGKRGVRPWMGRSIRELTMMMPQDEASQTPLALLSQTGPE